MGVHGHENAQGWSACFSRQTAWCLRVPLLGHGGRGGDRDPLFQPLPPLRREHCTRGSPRGYDPSRFDIEICLTSWKTQFGKSSMNPRSDKIEGLVLFFFSLLLD